MLLFTGFGDEKSENTLETYYVTKPLYIEFPRSLVQVVIYWNVPMHTWLKKCKFTSKLTKRFYNF